MSKLAKADSWMPAKRPAVSLARAGPVPVREDAAGPLKVAIVDPDAAARARLSQLLSRTVVPPASVVLECSTAAIFAVEGPRLALDAAFIDVTMPGGWRLAERDCRSMFEPDLVFVAGSHEYASRAFDLEAVDFLTKPFSEDRLIQTLHRLWRHRRPPGARNASDTLTERQIQILELLGQGLSNKVIAKSLGVSHFTVRNHISQLFRLFEVSRRVELATFVQRAGLTRITSSRPRGFGEPRGLAPLAV